MTLIASILGGLGRSRRVPRTGLWQLNSKRGPRNFYKGKGVAPTGRHTRKGGYVLDKLKLPNIVVPDLTGFKASDGRDTEASSSSEEESDASQQLDEGFLKAFARIKQRDASIYNADARLFDGGSPSGSGSDDDDSSKGDAVAASKAAGRQKEHPKFLRQVLAEQALQGGSSDSEDSDADRPQTYTQEQHDVKNAFLEAAGEVDEDLAGGEFGQVLKQRRPGSAGGAGVDSKPVIKELLVSCFDGADNPEDAFLRDFLQGQHWRDDQPDDAAVAAPLEDAGVADLDADQDYLHQADRYEAQYNFRFEEPGAAHTITHPRVVEGSVRRSDERRKQARERKAKRKEEEARRQQDEAKRARNAARAKAGDRRSQVQEVRDAAGVAGPDAAKLQALMDSEDWDPGAYDAAMQSAFGEDYYQQADDAEAEMLEGEDAEDGAQPVGRDQTGDVSGAAEEDEDHDDDAAPATTGFRYRPVPKQDYGLDIVDLLQLDAKELNQVVGLKRLAPYREERGRQYANTQKLQELRKGQELQTRRRKPPKQAVTQNGSAAAPEAGRKARRKAEPLGGDGAAVAADPATQQPAADGSEEAKRIAKQPRAGGLTATVELAAGNADAADAEKAAAERKAARRAEREREQRLQSYGKLTLRPEGGSKGTKRKAEAAADAQAVAADGLTRGERKRLKRSQKRAAKRASDGPGVAVNA